MKINEEKLISTSEETDIDHLYATMLAINDTDSKTISYDNV